MKNTKKVAKKNRKEYCATLRATCTKAEYKEKMARERIPIAGGRNATFQSAKWDKKERGREGKRLCAEVS